AQLRRRRSDVRLVVVGEGAMRWGYERYIESEGIPDVHFTGHVDARLLPRCYGSADLFCAPAIGKESFGIVLLEAMASGVPVLASRIPGFAQVVTPDRDGLLLPPGQPEPWGEALEALLDDDGQRRALAEAGRRTARACWWRLGSSCPEGWCCCWRAPSTSSTAPWPGSPARCIDTAPFSTPPPTAMPRASPTWVCSGTSSSTATTPSSRCW